MEEIIDSYGIEGINSVIEAVLKHYDESAQRKHKTSAADWWRVNNLRLIFNYNLIPSSKSSGVPVFKKNFFLVVYMFVVFLFKEMIMLQWRESVHHIISSIVETL